MLLRRNNKWKVESRKSKGEGLTLKVGRKKKNEERELQIANIVV